jgi:hypothetical protein
MSDPLGGNSKAMNIVTRIVGHSPTSDFASRIIACWQRSAEAFIETGRILMEAKAALPHGDFLQMVEAELAVRQARGPDADEDRGR